MKSIPLKRALAAIGGSGGLALSSLILSLLLIQQTSAEVYGIFAFSLLTQALGFGVSNALLGSPLLIKQADDEVDAVQSLFLSNFIYSLFFACVQAIVIYIFTLDFLLFVVYFVLSFFTTLRWFGRAYCNGSNQHSKVVLSDAVYTIFTIVFAAYFFISKNASLLNFGLVLMGASIFSFYFLGSNYTKKQIFGISNANLTGFKNGYTSQGKHALLGVISSEFTSNSHSYLITLLFGPAYFAPIAAATLLFRPVIVVMNSLVQVDRPRIRKQILNGLILESKSSLKKLFVINGLFFVFNVIIAAFIVFYYDFIKWEVISEFDFYFLVSLISIITLVKLFSCILSMFLQAANQFKNISYVIVKSSIISFLLVSFFLVNFEPIDSLLGILFGEVFCLIMIYRLYRGVKIV